MKQDSMAVLRDKLVDFAQKKEDALAVSRDPVGYKRPGETHTPNSTPQKRNAHVLTEASVVGGVLVWHWVRKLAVKTSTNKCEPTCV